MPALKVSLYPVGIKALNNHLHGTSVMRNVWDLQADHLLFRLWSHQNISHHWRIFERTMGKA